MGLEDLFVVKDIGWCGPSPRAVEILERRGRRSASFTEELLLRVAFDIWNAGGDSRLSQIVTYLEPRVVLAIGTLLAAIAESSERVDEWISTWGRARNEQPGGGA